MFGNFCIRLYRFCLFDSDVQPLYNILTTVFYWFRHTETLDTLNELFKQRVCIIDGAMGTEIQTYKLSDADYRGTFDLVFLHPFHPLSPNEHWAESRKFRGKI